MRRRQTNKGLYGMPFFNGVLYRVTIFFLRVLGRTVWRWRLDGLEKVPDEEPFLLLPNHSTLLDPFLVGSPIDRGVMSMASASVLRVPLLGAFLKAVGSFPKMKYTKDKAAMQKLQQRFEQGFAILLFPEGNRCWNGETAQLLPGVGRLIKRLNCKVMYARMHTAYLYQPRWASYPRWVPIQITYDGPYSYTEDQTAEEITADAQAKLTVSSQLKVPARTWGFRMAHGLPQYLWACPRCLALEALEVCKDDGNAIQCVACAARWTLDVQCILRGETEMSVAEAFKSIATRFGAPPIADQQEFEATGVALKAAYGELHFVPRGKQERVLEASGEVQIERTGLRWVDEGNVIWEAPFGEIKALSVELANLLHFRVEDRLYRITISDESPLKWDHFLRKWRLHAVGSEH